MLTYANGILNCRFSNDLHQYLTIHSIKKDMEIPTLPLQITRGLLGGCYVSNSTYFTNSKDTISYDLLMDKFFKCDDVQGLNRNTLPDNLYPMDLTVDKLTVLTGRVNIEIENAPRIWRFINSIREIVLLCLGHKNYRSGRELNTFAERLSWGALVGTFGKELIEADQKNDGSNSSSHICSQLVADRRRKFEEGEKLTQGQREDILTQEISKIPHANPEFFVYFIKKGFSSSTSFTQDDKLTIVKNWPARLTREKLEGFFTEERAKAPNKRENIRAYDFLTSCLTQYLVKTKQFNELAAIITTPIGAAGDKKKGRRFLDIHRDFENVLSFEEFQQIGKLCGLTFQKQFHGVSVSEITYDDQAQL